MAECPLPKPNTRVRFPSPAPKRNSHASRGGSFLAQLTDLKKLCARNARSRRICNANLRKDCIAIFQATDNPILKILNQQFAQKKGSPVQGELSSECETEGLFLTILLR